MNKILMLSIFLGLLVGCATSGSKDSGDSAAMTQSILDKTWLWHQTVTPAETLTVNHPERYTLLFLADGNAQVRFDCNRGGGSYKMGLTELNFGPMISTRRACLGDSLDHVYATNLEKVHAFQYDTGTGQLKLMFDGGDMYFRAKP